MNLFKNTFIQALGIAALVYLMLQALGWGIESILRALEGFSRWYRYSGSKWLEEVAIVAGLVYLLFAAVVNSRNSH